MVFHGSDFRHLWWLSALFSLLFAPSMALSSDGGLLLSFKYSVLSDPLSVLDNWNYSDISPCSWTGVTCAEIGAAGGSPEMFRVISLVLPGSKLLGSVTKELGFIPHLRTLDLSGNFLNGTLPTSIFNATELEVISLANNLIYGEIPVVIGGLKSLRMLNLSSNDFAGKVPESLASLQNLTVVSLRSNYFSGEIPSGFQNAEVMDLSSNLLNGSLPVEFGGESLRYLNLSNNKFSGFLPPGFAEKFPAKASVDLSFNNLTGPIPPSAALRHQKTESFAGNMDMCGKPLQKLCTIPSTLSNPPNASSKSSPLAIAAIPKIIDSNPRSNSPGNTDNQLQRGLKPGTVAGIVVGDLAGIGILGLVILYVYQLKKKKKSTVQNKAISIVTATKTDEETTDSKDGKGFTNCSCLNMTTGEETSTGYDSDDYSSGQKNESGNIHGEKEAPEKKQRSLVMVDGETELELETLLKASAYVLGSTGPSIVYRAVLENGTAFAVRRIGESGVRKLKEFDGEVRAIAKLRHPNLVQVRGFYWGDDEKLVIYDYVSNGSLANVGYRKMGSSPYYLPFGTRLKIAQGVARGLTYIHEKKHVHGNIKPTNILLTPDMEPIIADYGLDGLISGHHRGKTDVLARHFGSKRCPSSSRDGGGGSNPSLAPTTGFMGCTSPYHAPESLNNLKPNPKWDVYSFGIVLLELLTGRVFSDRELNQWTAGSVLEDKTGVLRMADVAIRADVARRESDTLACFRLGFGCASLVPTKRPSMKDALQVLEKIPC